MSKHGGSESLGLEPAGLQSAPLAPGSSVILEAPVSQEIRERQVRKLNFERRRVALEVLPTLLGVESNDAAGHVERALEVADLLIAKTGGEL
jgi:hypothetical protein